MIQLLLQLTLYEVLKKDSVEAISFDKMFHECEVHSRIYCSL